MIYHTTAALRGKGAAGKFTKNKPAWVLFVTVLRAYRDALARLPPVLAERRKSRHLRILHDGQFTELLRRFRLTAREAAWKE
jgi:hypothetical protein